MENNNNTIKTILVLALIIPLLVCIPSIVLATPIEGSVTFATGDISASLAVEAQEIGGGQWMYTYTLTNDPGSVELHEMNIGWVLDDNYTPLVSAVEIGILNGDGEIAASYLVPPASPYSRLIYESDTNGTITAWDWALSYTSKFRFTLAAGATLDTLYIVYDDFVSLQDMYVGGSGKAPGTLSVDAPVPEPGTLLLLGSGLFSLGVLGRRKFKSL